MIAPAPFHHEERLQRGGIAGLAIGIVVTIAANAVILVILVLVTAARHAPPKMTTIHIAQTNPAPPPVTPPQIEVAAAHAAPTPRIPEPSLPPLPAAMIGDPDLALPLPLAPVAVTLPPVVPAWAVANAGNRADATDLDQQTAPPPPADTAPVLIGSINLKSFYPYDARIHGITGASSLTMDIDATGAVTGATVQESTPRGVFDEAAKRLALALHFRPAQSAGKAVPVTLPYQIYWTLDR